MRRLQEREEVAEQRRQERDAAEQRRQEAAREAAAQEQAATLAAVAKGEANTLAAIGKSRTEASKDLMCVLDQVHGVGRKVARVEKATVPIAESVERLAVQVQAQAAVSARPGLRARPGGNDENKPPMRFGLGPR